jgi:hypothetical protein
MKKKIFNPLFVLVLLLVVLCTFAACKFPDSSGESVLASKSFEFGNTNEEIIEFVKNHLEGDFHIAYTITFKNPFKDEVIESKNISMIKTTKGYYYSYGKMRFLVIESNDGFGYDSHMFSDDYSNAVLTQKISKDEFDESIMGFIREFAAYYYQDIPLNIELMTKNPDEIFLGRICVKYTHNNTNEVYLIDKETGVMLIKTDDVKGYECTLFTTTSVSLPSLPPTV